MAFATKTDFEVRHGPGDERVEPLLDDATALIRSELAGAEADWLTDDKVETPAAVKGICVAIAYRVWSNPDALSSEALGEHTQAWADRSGEALRITDTERQILEGEAGVGSFVSVDLVSPYAGPSTSTVDEDL